MPKVLTIVGMVIAVLILLLFLVDLAIGFPFHRAYWLMDALFVVCAGILGYLSWSTFAEIQSRSRR